MKQYLIKGPNKGVSGTIDIEGAKNSCLPLLASSILFQDSIVLTNVPLVKDVLTMCNLLEELGSKVEISEKNKTIKVINKKKHKLVVPYKLISTMRAGVLLMGALLGKYSKNKISCAAPGGCSLGERFTNFHIAGFKRLGAKYNLKNGYTNLSAKNGLIGNTYKFPKVSVTGTCNLIMAAVFAKNTTTLKNVSLEPEVLDVISFLNNSSNSKFIKFTGKRTLQIKGITKLIKGSHKVIGDRVAAFSYLCVGVITRGKIKVNNVNPKHLPKELEVLKRMGCEIKTSNSSIAVNAKKKLKPVSFKTNPWPEFATDNMPILMAVLTTVDGKSKIEENVFSQRFQAAPELNRLGASISIKKNTATIIGQKKLYGAQCISSDLRSSFAIILGSIVAIGNSQVQRIYHNIRGYYQLPKKLKKLGINIKVIK
ncbi:UDP-N-acetylglucosamine 1-carboxyvinyltransferase [Candidatus Pelagibacter sp.]|nr:UDP-N-acetylglucosamine 1-carboxyvinyltransferase [Candidatus Pelagibacter sp.]